MTDQVWILNVTYHPDWPKEEGTVTKVYSNIESANKAYNEAQEDSHVKEVKMNRHDVLS